MVMLVHFSGVFGDLVEEVALGVDVLGPRLAVESHLVAILRKKLSFDFFLSELNRSCAAPAPCLS